VTGSPRSREAGPLLGAHMSVAGGLEKAVDRAAEHRCTALQIFTRNGNRWDHPPLDDDEISRWREAIGRRPLAVIVHDSYLINLASPDRELHEKSRAAFLEEARRCTQLGIPGLVFHPGAHMEAGEDAGLRRVVDALNWVDRRLDGRPLRFLIENTAGQGTTLGRSFEHIAVLLDGLRNRERAGVCLDTCHLLAAGYDFRDDAGYAAVFAEADRVFGLDAVRAFHLNDSKQNLGCRVDRHENIGKGFVGSRAFHLLMRDSRFLDVPKVLETPKAGDMDKRNLALLRRFASTPVHGNGRARP